MIALTDEQKRYFCTSGNFKEYEFYFPELFLTIDNETLHSESVVLQESICDTDELTLGGCISGSVTFEASELTTQILAGQEFYACIVLRDEVGNENLRIPMGVFYVDSAKKVDDKDYKQITAYDQLYKAGVDVSKWYNTLFPIIDVKSATYTGEEDGEAETASVNVYATTTLKVMRESLLRHLGLSCKIQELPNDSMVVEDNTAFRKPSGNRGA